MYPPKKQTPSSSFSRYRLVFLVTLFFLGFPLSNRAQQNCVNSGNTGYNSRQNLSSCDINLSNVDVKEVRVIYHVFQKSDGSENIPNTPQGRGFLANLHNKANQGFANLEPMTWPTSSSFFPDSKIQLYRVDRYFWQDDNMHSKGNRFNPQHGIDMYNYVMQQNIPGKYTAIHIFIPGNYGSDPDNVAGRAADIGCLEWTMLEDVYYRYQNGQAFWKHAPVLMHEIGHNLSLRHVFNFDYCDDTNGHIGPAFQNASTDNNMMGYNSSQLGLTQDQVTRMHHFIHQNQFVLQSGQTIEVLDGDITQSGNNGPLYTVHNTMSASATVIMQLPNGAPLTWTKTSGNGNFTVNGSGSQVTLSNLGSISFDVSWTDNCLDYQASYTFYNQPSFRIQSEGDEIIMTAEIGAANASAPNALLVRRIEIFDQAGVQRKTINLKDPTTAAGYSVDARGLPPGTYRVVVYTPYKKVEENVWLE